MTRTQLPKLDDRQLLGRELKVSPICMGMTLDARAVSAAFDAGINFFFISTDMHWPLYEHLRRGLETLLDRGGGIRDDIVVAGASYATQPEFCTAPYRELIDNVRGLERLDVLVAGGAYGREISGRMPIYAMHRERAYCGARAFGVSFHDRAAAAAEANAGTADLCLIRYNALHPGASKDLFPRVGERRARLYNFKTTFGYVPPDGLARLGLDPETWCPEVVDHFRYVLTPPEVDGVLCKLDSEQHVLELGAALEDGPLEPEEVAHIELLARLAYGNRFPDSG